MSKTTKKRLINLEKYIQNKWDIHYWNLLMKHQDKLKFQCTSKNTNITTEIIEKYPEKPWDWGYISLNPNITLEFIEKYPEKPWDWYYISLNPNTTMEIINKYHYKFQSGWSISSNKFTKEKELFYQKYYRIYLATFKLQQYFNRMYDNPKYLFCRNRLDKLFSESFNIKLILYYYIFFITTN
jgi:hypothetical protein